MTTITDIETRLRHRLGLAKTVALGDSRITEAINSGIARAYADGVPGLSGQTLLGRTYGDLALTVSAHSAGSSIFKINTTPAYVFPGDIVTIGTNKYLVASTGTYFEVDASSDPAIDVGIPIESAIAGSTAITVTRRSIQVPNGTIYYAALPDSDSHLEPSSRVLAQYPDNTGVPRFYATGYSEGSQSSYLNLIPAPTSATLVSVQCHDFKARSTGSATINIPEAAIDAILERARQAFLGWSGNVGSIEASLAQNATKDTQNQIRAVGSDRSVRTKK